MPVLYPRDIEMFSCLVPDLLSYILVFMLSTKELKCNLRGREEIGVREEQRNSYRNMGKHALMH